MSRSQGQIVPKSGTKLGPTFLESLMPIRGFRFDLSRKQCRHSLSNDEGALMPSEAAKTDGVFSWKRRYAVHRAFHRRKATQIAHLLGTPLQLFSFIKLLTLVSFSETTVQTGYNLGLLFVAFLASV